MEQLEVPVAPATRVHGDPLIVAVPVVGERATATVPPGLLAVPALVSVTVAVQVTVTRRANVVWVQLKLVEVDRVPTVRFWLPLLVPWASVVPGLSPP